MVRPGVPARRCQEPAFVSIEWRELVPRAWLRKPASSKDGAMGN